MKNSLFIVCCVLLFGFLGSTAFAQEQDRAVQETNEPQILRQD